eukprot:jgi/Bigna1/83695/fgenesh1_pg.113_\
MSSVVVSWETQEDEMRPSGDLRMLWRSQDIWYENENRILVPKMDVQTYESEKKRLGKEINKKLGEVLTSLKELNRNVHNLNQVSDGISDISGVWEKFVTNNDKSSKVLGISISPYKLLVLCTSKHVNYTAERFAGITCYS